MLFLGWQPGIQETAASWDEEWDRFGDEGMRLNLDSATMSIIECMFMLTICILNSVCCSACIYPGFSIIKELTVEVEPPIAPKSQPTEDAKANGASTEKEDSKGDKSAAAEQAVEPETTPSNSKPESAKSPPVSPVKNKEDGSTDERDKKQSGTNDVSPRATESIRYRSCFSFYIIDTYLAREKDI